MAEARPLLSVVTICRNAAPTIAASAGEWILLLNAGDSFTLPGSLSQLAARTGTGARIVSARARCGRRTIPRYAIRPGLGLLLRAHISHQATLVRRDVYAEYGAYDESFLVRMDFDFFLRVLRREVVEFVDRELVQF